MNKTKTKRTFIEGPIKPEFIADSIGKHRDKKNIGAHSIFLGQVRNDIQDGKEVIAIEYSAYNEMAEQVFHEIREAMFSKYNLCCLHIYHSLGRVPAGEISLFVFASSTHRRDATEACAEIVEEIKQSIPVWGKEIFSDETFNWKENTPFNK